ncbi:hypothetical protein D3C84_852830 [compost metagenome]
MDGETADFLVGIVRDWYDFAVLAFLSSDLLRPCLVFDFIRKAGKSIGISHPSLPIHTHRHPLLPTCRRDITAPAPATLVGPDNVDPRTAIDTEMIDGPVGVVDGLKGAGLDVLRECGGSQIDEHGNDYVVYCGYGHEIRLLSWRGRGTQAMRNLSRVKASRSGISSNPA